MHQALPFDLSQLQNQCVLRSDVRADSHDLVARELTDHKLQWQRGAVSMSLSKTKLRKLGLYVLEYGPEVEIAPRPYGDFVVVHVTLEGRAEVASDGQFLALPEGRTAVIHARRNLRLRWQEGSRHLLIKVPHTLLEQGLSESPQAAWSSMSPAWLFPQEADAQWKLLVQSLLQSSSSIAALPAGESWLDHFERSVAFFLWEQAKAAGSVTCTTATPDVVEPESPSTEPNHKGLLAGALLTLGNPKAVVFFGAILPQAFSLGALSVAQALLIVGIGALIDLSVQSAYLVAASKARGLVSKPERIRAVNRGAASMIFGCALVVGGRA